MDVETGIVVGNKQRQDWAQSLLSLLYGCGMTQQASTILFFFQGGWVEWFGVFFQPKKTHFFLLIGSLTLCFVDFVLVVVLLKAMVLL